MSPRVVDIDILQKIYKYTKQNYSKKEIARKLNLSATTVEKYQKKFELV